MKIDLLLTPQPLPQFNLEGKIVVVIDVLRSSTTICAALKAGAKGIIPVNGVGQAGERRNMLGSDVALLAGEKDGVRIDNFDMGNSPQEFNAEVVSGKIVVMATTNGTAPFAEVNKADFTFACGFVNISAIADRIAGSNRDLIIVCAGQAGAYSIEDTLCGGMLAQLLQTNFGLVTEFSDGASLASLLYDANREDISKTVHGGQHGRHLNAIGFANDIDIATAIDSISVIPILKNGQILLEEAG